PLVTSGEVELAAIVDRRPREEIWGLRGRVDPDLVELLARVPYFTELDALLATVHLDVLIIATPLPTHASYASAAMSKGIHVLLEKPPTTTMASFEQLLSLSQKTGAACQVGFQTFGSDAFERIDSIIASGEI